MAEGLERERTPVAAELAAARAKIDAVLRSLDDGLILVDRDLCVTEVNAAAARLLRRATGGPGAMPLPQFVDDQRLLECVRRAVATGHPPDPTEEAALRVDTDGHARELLYSVTPIRTAGGDVLGAVVRLRDGTRLKALEQLKSQFMMTASHELRTPLTSIGMVIELLVEGAMAALDQRQQRLLLTAHEEVGRLRGLVDELLDLARIESGQIAVEFSRVSVPECLARVVASLAPQAERRQVELSCEADPGLPEAWADARKVSWVLTNLVSNALRYVAPNGHVCLSVERVGRQLQVAVRDDGAGIPAEAQARIFDKFVQLDDGGPSPGLGLGLALCREIVLAHGGTIWVDSAPGTGSTFTFTLALAAPQF